MKRVLIILMTTMLTCTAYSQQWMQQPQGRFDPQRFQKELEQYITKEAGLTPKEAAAFFPVYREMMNKQRAVYAQAARYRYMKPKDDAECKKVILRRDELDLQVKEIQKTYHEKFLKIIPATKVFDVINAEDSFHRQSLRWMGGRNNQMPGRNGQMPGRNNQPGGRK
jgi:hypothetical protein